MQEGATVLDHLEREDSSVCRAISGHFVDVAAINRSLIRVATDAG